MPYVITSNSRQYRAVASEYGLIEWQVAGANWEIPEQQRVPVRIARCLLTKYDLPSGPYVTSEPLEEFYNACTDYLLENCKDSSDADSLKNLGCSVTSLREVDQKNLLKDCRELLKACDTYSVGIGSVGVHHVAKLFINTRTGAFAGVHEQYGRDGKFLSHLTHRFPKLTILRDGNRWSLYGFPVGRVIL